ncbi:MAG TPA: presqualene diphosphate synthase HpnD [Rhizomicrobium sp.]|jgi:phytoene synthase|nr:presqualene diphosphate synthase HpnD [Rhizomicrobium sp.]
MSAAEPVETAPEIRAIEQKAQESSFYTAMKLMAKPEREAMFAIYAFCRAVDDIADDGVGTREERHAALDAWRADLESLYAGGVAGRAAFLAGAMQRYGLRKADFLTVIDGMDMDVAEDIVAPPLEMLDLYCERVASAVGRLSIKVFGMEEDPGFELAHHLGRALQLTNILRDLDADARIGRLYLPREYCDDAHLAVGNPKRAVRDPAIDSVCRLVAPLAHGHFDGATRVLRSRPKGKLRAPKLMAAVYSEILREMEKQGWTPPRRRVSLSKPRLAAIVLAHGLIG